ncbi:hypothetical protein GUJ93_ZPchr0015g6713 [Zizania palustris]|uniref:Uncharacterized protein n=1 Tax=Zizania palustris TaxID=103762 RepID=A0A8J5W112_ZIZPA|nr:hypothetical protein GUJ93_ZPchr0015g6713 [Zizania palustris]
MEGAFQARFNELAALSTDHLALVAEDTSTGLLDTVGAVLMELKFIRSCGRVGSVEDVVVNAVVRGCKLEGAC